MVLTKKRAIKTTKKDKSVEKDDLIHVVEELVKYLLYIYYLPAIEAVVIGCYGFMVITLIFFHLIIF